MNDDSNKFLDETISKWIEENKENLQSLYKDYCSEYNDTTLTFEDFAVYTFYQSEH